jgi:hypothetical protein
LRTVRRWLTGTALAAGLLLAASPAIAAHAAPAAASPAAGPRVAAAPAAVDTFNICLLNSIATRLCLVSNGAGNQVTIGGDPGRWAVWHKAGQGTGPGGVDKQAYENASGNCLRAAAPPVPGQQGVVKIKNGGCGTTDGADFWDKIGGGKLQSDFYPGTLLLVHGAVSGNNVWHFSTRSGDWAAWALLQIT